MSGGWWASTKLNIPVGSGVANGQRNATISPTTGWVTANVTLQSSGETQGYLGDIFTNTFTALTPLPGYTSAGANKVNDAGTVVGWSYKLVATGPNTAGQYQATVWYADATAPVQIGPAATVPAPGSAQNPGFVYGSMASNINEIGQILWGNIIWAPDTFNLTAFAYRDSTPIPNGGATYNDVWYTAINEDGAVTGTGDGGSSGPFLYIWDGVSAAVDELDPSLTISFDRFGMMPHSPAVLCSDFSSVPAKIQYVNIASGVTPIASTNTAEIQGFIGRSPNGRNIWFETAVGTIFTPGETEWYQNLDLLPAGADLDPAGANILPTINFLAQGFNGTMIDSYGRFVGIAPAPPDVSLSAVWLLEPAATQAIDLSSIIFRAAT